MKWRSPFLWKFNFFGLTLEYRINLFKSLHEIIFYGRGGYTYNEVYNFPIWLRNITYKFISDSINSENEASANNSKQNLKISNKSSSNTNINLANPNKSSIPSQYKNSPTYTTKASFL